VKLWVFEDSIEVVRENRLGSTEQLKKVKEKSELVKDIIMVVLPVAFVLIILVIMLVRFLFK